MDQRRFRCSRDTVSRVPGSFELFRKIIVRPAGSLAMRLEQLDDLHPLFWVLHMVPCREDALSRDDDGAIFDGTTRDTADNLNGGTKTCLPAEQLLHAADCGCVFEEEELGEMEYLDGETCTMSAFDQNIYCGHLSYLRLRD
jgi:hypothetical protein